MKNEESTSGDRRGNRFYKFGLRIKDSVSRILHSSVYTKDSSLTSSNLRFFILHSSFIFFILHSSFFISHSYAQQQRGKASYYSKRANGARTSSGERLNNDSLVCAHRTYPFGTMLKVTNLVNNKWTIVRVIDRGPFGRGRVIDLSYAAAKELGMLSQGVASVLVEPASNVVIPFRPEKNKLLPEIDFEVNEGGNDSVPIWHDYERLKEMHSVKPKKMAPKRKVTEPK